LQSDENFCGGGIWTPPAAVLRRIRESIDRNQDDWIDIKEFILKASHISFSDGERCHGDLQQPAAVHAVHQ
jgi:uncharacterized protein (DUF2461 family)